MIHPGGRQTECTASGRWRWRTGWVSNRCFLTAATGGATEASGHWRNSEGRQGVLTRTCRPVSPLSPPQNNTRDERRQSDAAQRTTTASSTCLIQLQRTLFYSASVWKSNLEASQLDSLPAATRVPCWPIRKISSLILFTSVMDHYMV